MSAIVVFFSRAGENYIGGRKQLLSIGNTKILAEKINRYLAIPAYQLTPSLPYPENYDEVVQQAEREKQGLIRVDYQEVVIDFKDVDTIFLGFPNWWGTYPQIIAAFLADHDLENKVIYPFCTHEGSAFGSSLEDLRRVCPGAEIKTGLAFRGSKVNCADTAVENWLLDYQNKH